MRYLEKLQKVAKNSKHDEKLNKIAILYRSTDELLSVSSMLKICLEIVTFTLLNVEINTFSM